MMKLKFARLSHPITLSLCKRDKAGKVIGRRIVAVKNGNQAYREGIAIGGQVAADLASFDRGHSSNYVANYTT